MRGVWGKVPFFQLISDVTQGELFWKPMHSLHGKCHILNSVKQPCGETIFRLTVRFPKLEVFQKLCGTYAELPYTQLSD